MIDDTPIRVLDRSLRDKGLGKGVRQGRIWAYVRDQRPWAGSSPPGAVYRFAPDWKEEHVLGHRHCPFILPMSAKSEKSIIGGIPISA